LLLLSADRAAIDRYLLPAGPTAANPPQRRVAAEYEDRQIVQHSVALVKIRSTLLAIVIRFCLQTVTTATKHPPPQQTPLLAVVLRLTYFAPNLTYISPTTMTS